MSDIDQTILRLWERSRRLVAERLDLLEAAARASAQGNLESVLRADAAAVAHKLAGSLGTYGIPEGSDLALTLEQELEGDCEPARLMALIADLRSVTGLTT